MFQWKKAKKIIQGGRKRQQKQGSASASLAWRCLPHWLSLLNFLPPWIVFVCLFPLKNKCFMALFAFFCLPGLSTRRQFQAGGCTGRRSPVSFLGTRSSRMDLVKAMSRQTDGSTCKTGRQGAASQAGVSSIGWLQHAFAAGVIMNLSLPG